MKGIPNCLPTDGERRFLETLPDRLTGLELVLELYPLAAWTTPEVRPPAAASAAALSNDLALSII
jgi:hypothetical protein